MDKLVCVLCRGNYKQPKMCPNCSQIYCGKCITDYLNKHHLCPSCGHLFPELADCTRLIAQLRQHVKPSQKKLFKNCSIHNLPLKYQCIDCAVPICSDCGVIEEKHRGHQLQPRGSVTHELPRARLKQYLLSLEQCLLKDHSRFQQLSLERQVLKSQLRWCKNKLREYYEQMNKRLDDETTNLMSEILTDMQDREERMQKLKKTKEDITQILEIRDLSDQQALQRMSVNNKILEQLQFDNPQAIFVKLQQLLEEYKDQAVFFNFNRKSLTTLNEVYPEYINHNYQFNYEASKLVSLKYSQPFYIYGQQWRLKIYPSGNGQAHDHLSLFLQLLNAPNPTIGSNSNPQQYYFRLQLISLNTAGKTISKQYKSPFTAGDCWGYNNFVRIRDLGQFLNNGQLIFVVGIRNCSYFDVCQNMRRYIRKLQGQKKVLEQLLSSSNASSGLMSSRAYEIQSFSHEVQQNSNIIDSD